MQNKGAIKFFAIAFAIVSLFQLSFTFFAINVEKKAKKYATSEKSNALAEQIAQGDQIKKNYVFDSIVKSRERFYLDSMSNETIFNILIRKYTYQECKEREINLGLDLKGGMNVLLEVSVKDIIIALSSNSQDASFRKALALADEKQRNSQSDYLTLFADAFNEVEPNGKLAAIFNTVDLKERVTYKSTNQEVVKALREETNKAFDRTLHILRSRIDRYGVTQPNIQALPGSGRILVELPGVKEPERVRKLLQGTAMLEFWETYKFSDISHYFEEANRKLAEMTVIETSKNEVIENESATKEDKKEGEEVTLDDLIKSDDSALEGQDDFLAYSKKNPLYAYLQPSYFQTEGGGFYPAQSATVGYAKIQDTAKVNQMLSQVSNIFPRNLKLAWMVKPREDAGKVLELVALKITTRDGSAPLGGDAITNARQDYNADGGIEISMSMNSEGARVWKRLTGDNIGSQIAIVLDNLVYSAPNVSNEISNGRSSISGNFSIKDAKDLANILEAGKLPAPANIVQEEVVGPSLGREAITSGLRSFLIAFLLVIIFIAVYYRKAGFVANIALITNIFFIFGVLASLGAVLTLPGIAGIVLTLGMAIDANVIIYERIKEELRLGKGMRLAITDGYKNAYSAIIDGNITTLLTGIVLYVFGTGPVQGFATTLIIGILSSLFTSIFISRVIFEKMLQSKKGISFGSKWSMNTFTNLSFDFISMSKVSYIISGVMLITGLTFLFTKGLDKGVDFMGGRTYVVRFDKDISLSDIRSALADEFEGEIPEVKTFGSSRQVKITTTYLVEDNSLTSDSVVEAKLYDGLKGMFEEKVTKDEFLSAYDNKVIGKLSSQKVGPTVADDLLYNAYLALFAALLMIFAYIAFRFGKWQYGLAALISQAHDAIIVLSLYSIGTGVLPFNLDIDQSTIAAILTIIGYSINATVIIFDRIRESVGLFGKRSLADNMNGAINSTLGRTIITSGTTFLVLVAIFIFGGEVIRGFAFALAVGILVGTYSSIFISAPLAYLFSNKGKKAAASK